MTYDSIYPEEALQYYRRKAMGGCAAVSTGELIVDTAFGRGSPNQICIDNPACKIPRESWPSPSPATGRCPRRS